MQQFKGIVGLNNLMFSKTLENCTVLSGGEEYDSITFDENIISLGGKEKGNQVLDMNGAVIVPGFVDSHMHLYSTALKLMTQDLEGLSRREVLLKLTGAKPNQNGWVVSRGWDESLWKKQEFLTPDEISNGNPVLAIRVDGHMAVLNKKGIMESIGLGLHVESDGVIKEGELDKLMSRIKPSSDINEAIMRAEEYCLSQGITSISDIETPDLLADYRKMQHKLRIVFNPIGLHRMGFNTGDLVSENLYMGHVKLFADGSVGARTAVMSDGYRDSDASPSLVYSDSQLEALYSEIISSGNDVMTHAIGDVAIDQVIRTTKKFDKGRLKIEHNEFVLPLRTEMEEKGMVVSMQPNFLRWSFKGGMYERRLGSGYIGLNNRFGSLLKNGVKVAFGSDSMPVGPMYGINLAMKPPTSGQKISFDQAIKCYTENSAYALHLEGITGMLEPGKKSDIVALDRNDLSVLKTYFEGVEKYSSH